MLIFAFWSWHSRSGEHKKTKNRIKIKKKDEIYIHTLLEFLSVSKIFNEIFWHEWINYNEPVLTYMTIEPLTTSKLRSTVKRQVKKSL